MKEQHEGFEKRKAEREAKDAASEAATAANRAETAEFQRELLSQGKRSAELLSDLKEQSQDQAVSLRSLAKASDAHTAALMKLLER